MNLPVKAATAAFFGEQPQESQEMVATAGNDQSLVSREANAVMGAIMAAKRFPRNQQIAFGKILDACSRPSLAEQAMYSYPRGGQEVEGVSIRLVEAVAQYWGNIESDWREVSRGDGSSVLEAVAWDLETNYKTRILWTVNHVRETKKGDIKLTGDRDIYELLANQASRRVRKCLQNVIPADVIEAACEACNDTLENLGKTKERAVKLIKGFAELGVSRDDIARRFGKKIEAITPQQYVQLQKIYKSIKDGVSDKDYWFVPAVSADVFKAASTAPERPAAVAIEADLVAARGHLISVLLDLKDRGGSWDKDSGIVREYKDWEKTASLQDMLVMADHLSKARLK